MMIANILLAFAMTSSVWKGETLAIWTNEMTSVRSAVINDEGLYLESSDWRGLGIALKFEKPIKYGAEQEICFRAKATAPTTGEPCVKARVRVKYEGEREYQNLSGAQFFWTIDGEWHDYSIRPFRNANGRRAIGVKIGLPPECRNSGKVTFKDIALQAHPIAPTYTVMSVQRDAWCEKDEKDVECRVRVWNRGTEDAKNVSIDDIPLNEEIEWLVKPSRAPLIPSDGTHTFRGRVSRRDITSSAIANVSYVPEPKPPKTKYEIAACYYPGWMDFEKWRVIERSCPERKPLLGWYDEKNPEVVDWQIKYMVEHGINIMMLDWYWTQGEIRLGHWLEAFKQARWRKYLKWFVMWCNESQKPIHTPEDNRRVTKYWIDEYFKMPEYYRTNDKPVVGIFVPEHYLRDFGSEAKVKAMLEESRAMAREAGYKGIHFIAYLHPVDDRSPTKINQWKRCGYDEIASYNFYGHHGKAESVQHFDFKHVVETSGKDWESRTSNYSLPFWPCASSGRDERPWVNKMEVYNRTPGRFKQICQDLKAMADRHGIKRIQLGPLNEWGEGSYLEPNREYGFGMYDAVRDVFCEQPVEGWPKNVTPSEVGLGPYDLKPAYKDPEAGKYVDFRYHGYCGFKELSRVGYHCVTTELSKIDGVRVVAKTVSPALVGDFEPFDPAPYRQIQLNLKTNAKRGHLKIYWRAEDMEWCEEASVGRSLICDGKWHVYTFDVAKKPAWRQRIYALRVQPVISPGEEYSLQWLLVAPTRQWVEMKHEIKSTYDGSMQETYFWAPEKAKHEKVPLIVGLHTWSGTIDWIDHYKTVWQEAKRRDWAFIGPNFRGANDHPEACGGEAAVQDIIDAVNYAKEHTNVDDSRVYIIGGSGGGHMTLLMLGRHPEIFAAGAAFCPITDCARWHADSLLKHPGRDKGYAKMLEGACGGTPAMRAQEYAKRSPLTWLNRAVEGGVKAYIATGIHDGWQGSVPIGHAIRAFNKFATDKVSEEDIAYVEANQTFREGLDCGEKVDPFYGESNRIHFRRTSGNARLTIFEGGHGGNFPAGFDFLSRQRKNAPVDWALPSRADGHTELLSR